MKKTVLIKAVNVNKRNGNKSNVNKKVLILRTINLLRKQFS